MRTITEWTGEVSPGTYFAHLFKVDADHYRLPAQQPRPHRDSEFLNRPYEMSDLMRLASAAGVWPR